MIKQLTKYLSLHALLRQHIQDKNREIFKFLDDKKLDATLDAIDAREGIVKLVNDIQGHIEKMAGSKDSSHKTREWYQITSRWIDRYRKDNAKILKGLGPLENSLKKEISSIHNGRVKLQGYNLNKISRPSSSR